MQPHKADYFDRDVCRPFYHKGSDRGVLLIHGFTGSCAHMRPLADALAERGYTVRTINLPGHACDEDAMKHSDWQQWLQAAKEAALAMREECRIFTVAGLSMGGVLALLIAQQMKVDACVTLSAPTAATNKALPFAKLAAPFIPRIAWGYDENRHRFIDPAYDFGYSGFPTQKGADLYRLIRMARSNLFSIRCPILCVQSDADDTISQNSMETILKGVSSEKRMGLWLEGMPHVITLTPEYPNIAEAMDKMMQTLPADE